MNSYLKKVLIISSWAPPAIGGPQNLYNLLRDFPEDSYCLLTSFYNIDNQSAKTGNWLKGKYIFYDNPAASGQFQSNPEITKEKSSRLILNKLKHLVKRSRILGALGGIFIMFSQIIMIIRTGKNSLQTEKIETMLGISDYGPAMIATYFLHKITKKPYSVFLFDLYKDNFYPVFPAGFLAKIFESKIFKKAEKIIVTNDGTLNYYTKEYGKEISKKITVIYNSTFPEPYLNLQTEYYPKPPYTILYTGRIGWPQIRSLKNLIKAIEQIQDIDINLKIYCPNPKDYLEKLGIRETEKIKILTAPPQKMPEIQTQADILFLPLSWHTKSQEIIDTATPGKLTDYLISNRPILIHAPSSTFLAQYAKENNFALVVDEENIEKLKNAIKTLLFNLEFAKQIIENAKDTFFKNHDANKNANSFKGLFLKSEI